MILWFKKILIRTFDLDEIEDLLQQARDQQKELDKKHWTKITSEKIDRLNKTHMLAIQDKDAEICLLNERIRVLESREKEIDDKEHFVKTLTKENHLVAQLISSQVESLGMNIMKFIGEMKGIRDKAETNHKKITASK